MSVLVTHAHNRLAYYATRCLAEHGIKVTCASEFPLAATFFSRYCTNHFTYPSPWKHPEQFIQKIIEEIKKREIEVLMPVHREGYILTKYKDQLDQQTKFPYPTFPQIKAVSDKAELVKTAEKANIRTPKTTIPTRLEQIEEAETQLKFPVIIKLRRSHGGIGQTTIQDPSNLRRAYLKTLDKYKISDKEEYPIIQQYTPGQTISVNILFNHGKPRAKFEVYNPEEDGVKRFAYYARNENKETAESLKTLAGYLNWHGCLNGQFKLDKKGGPPYLIDINPRFSGSLGATIMDGIEFPYLLYKIAVDGDTQTILENPKTRPTRWLFGDLSNIPKFIKKGNVKQAFKILTCRTALDFWDETDPIPFLTIPLYSLSQLIQHGTMQPLVEKY